MLFKLFCLSSWPTLLSRKHEAAWAHSFGVVFLNTLKIRVTFLFKLLQMVYSAAIWRDLTKTVKLWASISKWYIKSGKILCITDLNWPDGYSHDFFTINTINLTHGQWWYEHFDYGTLQIMGLNYYVERTRTGESKFMSNLSHLPDIRW